MTGPANQTAEVNEAVVADLWKQGKDTLDMAHILGQPEAHIERKLHRILDRRWVEKL